MRASEVLIIGAGPYGLSISTHLRGRGIDHLIVGRPMDTWRAHMPAAMYLKSEPYGSDMSCPQTGYDLEGYCRSERIDGIGRGIPLPLEQFLDYSDWYIKQLVPDVSDVTVTEIKAVNGGFQVTFADAEPITARNVVVATGVLPYRTFQLSCRACHPDLLSHTSDHRLFDDFQGRRVADRRGWLFGAGDGCLAARSRRRGDTRSAVPGLPHLGYQGPAAESGEAAPEQQALRRVEVPDLEFSDRLPPAAGERAGRRRRELCSGLLAHGGSRTGWRASSRCSARRIVRAAEPSGSGVRLQLDGPSGQSSLEVDHVIAGTGFRVDLTRLAYLPPELQARIATFSGYPVLTRAGESTVPGLYFVGAPAAFGLGPSMRFIAGTHNVARQLVRSVAAGANGSSGGASSGPGHEVLQSSDDAPSHQTA